MMGNWSQIEIAGKPADVFEPPEPPQFCVLFLHPLGQETLAGNPVWTAHLARLRMACVCPQGQFTWWADKICPEFDGAITCERYILDHVAPFCHERWRLASQAIGLTGISMGGQGALRLAFKHPTQFPVVAGVAPAIDYHEFYGRGLSLDEMYTSKEQCRQDSVILHVNPTHYPPHIFFSIDPDDADWFRGNDRLHEKLSALGISHECDLTTRAGGHTWAYFDYFAERVLTFLRAGLTEVSRRLL